LTKKELENYCKNKGIWVPKGAPKAAFEAAIVRAATHQKEIMDGDCFGFWESENATCLVCDLQSHCSSLSLGMDTEKYLKAFTALENPKIRTFRGLTKPKKS